VHSSLEVLGYSFTVMGHEVQSTKFQAIAGKGAGGAGMHKKQRGMTLLEVLLSVVVVAVGIFASAAMQLKALQATDSARRDGQAAFAVHSENERGRP
jgi:type IV pilus assembly protein PilV